jgi:hypothetical protein
MFLIVLAILSFAGTGTAEEPEIQYDRIPHLAITPSLNLNGFGYKTVSLAISPGINYEGKRLAFNGFVNYDNARKTNDGTGDNPHGHSRGFGGFLFVRLNKGRLAGGKASWGETSTTNYQKLAWGWSFGGGKDIFLSDFSCRLTAVYRLPYTDHVNGVQGPTLAFTTPSPSTMHHVYFVETLGVGVLHATITDPSNKELTEAQIHDRAHSANLSFGLMIKF